MMKTFLFETDMWLPRPRNTIFKFFEKAENLQTLTPEWLNFRIVTPLPIVMKPGAVIDYELKLFGLRFLWQSEISDWDPPRSFTDTQLRGPYHLWIHTHRFEERDGGTQIHDTVRYAPPGGPLAPLIDLLFVRRKIEQIFAYRRRQIVKVFEPRATFPSS
ncbi:SRPBCC family protein [bacterium]|nr:SRPBCC family protein [bacterium]